ncbi:hypothetical protein R1sor_010994 [Riccia sorocarpa]|uniref:Uncharacterized protein n=1 Tax=Riccia sorocarpa TaxID=122646 RepID=A0ABD3HZN1_9MARC
MPAAVEPERDARNGRRTTLTPHEHDQRMQNHARDAGSPESKNSRPPRPPGKVGDGGQGPNMKTFLASQQVAGHYNETKPTAVARHVIRKEGPNWILLVGGALVTAIGVLIVKKRKPPTCEEKIIEKAVATPGKDLTRRESVRSRTSEPAIDSPFSGDAYIVNENRARSQSDGSRAGSEWGEDGCTPSSPPGQCDFACRHIQFSKGSNHSSRTIMTPTSPPENYRESSTSEGNDMSLSPVNRSGYPSRRDKMHRLRQQRKSRDEITDDLIAQIADRERLISDQQAHCRDLEGRLEAANRSLFECKREIHRLRKALPDYLTSHVPVSELWDPSSMPDGGLRDLDDGYPDTTMDVFLSELHESGEDSKALIAEVKRLSQELKIERSQKRELEMIANEKLMENEILKDKLEQLEEELHEANGMLFEKDLLLQALENYQEYPERNPERVKGLQTFSLIGRQSLPGSLGSLFCRQLSKGKEEFGSQKAEASKFSVGTVLRTNSVLSQRSSDQSPEKSSSGKGRFKTDESSSPGDASEDSDVELSNPTVGEKLVMKLQEEVETLSFALAEHSKTISEKRSMTSRLVDELQRHNAAINDFQMKMEEAGEAGSETEEQDWEKLTGLLSFSSVGTSAAQVQELSQKLEQIATQQRVEEEMAELAKHQVKIRELKDRVDKLLRKFKSLPGGQSSADSSTSQQLNHIIAVASKLSEHLSFQEEEAKRTSKEIVRLSANFQLSSPYVPRSEKEALRKKLLRSSSGSLSPGVESGALEQTNLSSMLASLRARFSTGSEEKPKESGDLFFDRPVYVSSAELTGPQHNGGLASEMQEQYVYRPGFAGPSNRRMRRGFPISSCSGKEPLGGGKRRALRINKKGSSSEEREVVRSDSNRWTSNPRFQLASDDGNRQLLLSCSESDARLKIVDIDEDVSSPADLGTWNEKTDERRSLGAATMKEDECNSGRQSSHPHSRRQSSNSFYSVENSSFMRMGSPVAVENIPTPENSLESTKGSFGKFIFAMDKGSEVYVISPDEGVEDGLEDKPGTSLVEPSSPTTSVHEECSVGSSISGLSTDILTALRESSQGDRGEKSSGTYSDCSNSLDSSLDGMLDTALDDMVRLVSTPSSPAETPESSFMSSQSGSKSDSFYQL